MQSNEISYILSLSDGCQWQISSDGELQPWLDEFAHILGLKSGSNGSESAHLRFETLKNGESLHFTKKTGIITNCSGWNIYRQPSLALLHDECMQNFLCSIKSIDEQNEIKYANMWIALQSIYLKAIENGGIPLHAALIEYNGKGFLIAAEGDTGKTTCAKRLENIWTTLCDDEALVVLSNGTYRVHPFPTWSDYAFRDSKKSLNVEYSLLLSAIFFLEQSDRDEVLPMNISEAALMINSSAMQTCYYLYRDLNDKEKRQQCIKVFDNSCRLAKTVPAFILKAAKEGKFWEEIEKVF